MRPILVLAALVLAAGPAAAQTSPFGKDPAQTFQSMKPEDAARLNHAVQADPQARQALDQIQNHLSQGGHPAGMMLEKTRP
jgi:hypothetical protein